MSLFVKNAEEEVLVSRIIYEFIFKMKSLHLESSGLGKVDIHFWHCGLECVIDCTGNQVCLLDVGMPLFTHLLIWEYLLGTYYVSGTFLVLETEQ